MSITLHLTPSPLMRVFYVPEVEVECAGFPDLEDAACNAYLLWRLEYPDYRASLAGPDNKAAELRALNRCLFNA